MATIKIIDDSINEMDNLEVKISTAKPQTFDTLDEGGNPLKVTLNVVEPESVTTLGDLKKDLSNKEIALADAQKTLSARQKDYDDQAALIAQIQAEADKLPAR